MSVFCSNGVIAQGSLTMENVVQIIYSIKKSPEGRLLFTRDFCESKRLESLPNHEYS